MPPTAATNRNNSKKVSIAMKVRRTLIFPFEHQNSENLLTNHSLLYRAANWLETTMRALQKCKGSGQKSNNERQAQLFPPKKSTASSRQFLFRRCLIRTRLFIPIRERLSTCADLQRSGPYHW